MELSFQPSSSYHFGMDIRERREELGISQAALAEAAGTSQPQIDRLEKGQRKLTKEWAERLAPALKTTAQGLLFHNPDLTTAPILRVPLLTLVSAGSLTQVDMQDESVGEIAVAGLDPKGDWIALRVEGDSMDRISPPESVILVNRKDTRLVTNGLYVVADEDGTASYKRYRPNPDRFEPVSTNKELEPLFPRAGNMPKIIGRVRRTILDM